VFSAVRRVSFAGFGPASKMNPKVLKSILRPTRCDCLATATVPVCVMLTVLPGRDHLVYGSKWWPRPPSSVLLAILGAGVAFEMAYDYLVAAGRTKACPDGAGMGDGPHTGLDNGGGDPRGRGASRPDT